MYVYNFRCSFHLTIAALALHALDCIILDSASKSEVSVHCLCVTLLIPQTISLNIAFSYTLTQQPFFTQSISPVSLIARGHPLASARSTLYSLFEEQLSSRFISSFSVNGHWHCGVPSFALPIVRRSRPLSTNYRAYDLSEIPPSSTRDELRTFARTEFENNRNVTDLVCACWSLFKTSF